MNTQHRIIIFLLLLFPTQILADEGVFSTEIDNIHSATLQNGLEVIVIEDHALPIVTIEIAVHAGAYVEAPENNGLSHLYEHMFFKGNEAIPDQSAYLARQRALGMLWNGTTSDERVNYFFTLGSEQLCEGMTFMSNAIRTPLFKMIELEREREVVLGEFDRNEANPYFHLLNSVNQALFYAHPTRKDALGDRETVSTATVEQMEWFQQTFYIPNNAALFLAGDVTPDEGFSLAETLFGQWEAGPDPFIANPPVVHPPLEVSSAHIVEQPVQIATAMIGWQGPSVSEDPQGTFAADVFSFIVSQPAHRFQRTLVESGLTLSAGLSYYTQNNTGPIYLMLQMTPDNLEDILNLVRDEIERFDDPDYFTDAQLETAKTLLAVSELYSREQTTEWVHTVSFWWAVAGMDYYLDYVRNLQAVTREDILTYLQTYIIDSPHILSLLVSPEINQELALTPETSMEWLDGTSSE
jgi:zinc protease